LLAARGCRAYLVERVQQFRDQGASRARSAQDALEAKLVEVADEAVCRGAKGERVAPEVPLEGDDGGREHAGPDHGQGRLSAGKTRVQEGQTWDHDQDHGRGDENVGLVTCCIPLVQVFRHWEKSVLVSGVEHVRCEGLTGISTGDVVRSIELGWRPNPRVRHGDRVPGRVVG
jgi:hypothetical protein